MANQNKINRFLCSCEWSNTLKKLPAENRLKVYDAMFEFAQTGKVPELDLLSAIAFEPIKNEITRYMQTYKEKCSKLRSNAEKRWTTQEKSMQMDANAGKSKTKSKTKSKSIISNEINKENTLSSVKESTSTESTTHTQRKIFIPPSQEEVKQYMQEYVAQKANTGIKYDFKEEWAEDFVGFYGSKGWMVGKNKMTDWRLAASRWVRNQIDSPPKTISQIYPKIVNNHFEGEFNPDIYKNEEENWK